jgi:hypothetical protein
MRSVVFFSKALRSTMQVAGKWEEDKKGRRWEYEPRLRLGATVGPITRVSMRVFYGSSLFVDRSQIHNPNKLSKKYEIKRVIKFEFEQFHSKEGLKDQHMVYAAHRLFKITHRSRYIQPRPLCPSTAHPAFGLYVLHDGPGLPISRRI